MTRLILTLFLLFLVGCAGSVTVTSRGCDRSDNLWHSSEEFELEKFKIEKEFWTTGGANGDGKRFFLKKLLDDEGLKCSEVRNLNVTVKQSAWDIFVSFLPFINKMHLQISGEKMKISKKEKSKDTKSI